MRGDEAGTSIEEGAMHHYIHTYFEDPGTLSDNVVRVDGRQPGAA